MGIKEGPALAALRSQSKTARPRLLEVRRGKRALAGGEITPGAGDLQFTGIVETAEHELAGYGRPGDGSEDGLNAVAGAKLQPDVLSSQPGMSRGSFP